MAALFGQPLAYLLRCCYYTRKRRNVINFKKKFSEIFSFQDLILVTGGYWDNKYHYLVPFPPRGETRSIKDLILGFGFIRNMAKEAFIENLYHQG